MNILNLIRPNIRAMEPYSTARDEYQGGDISVWLDANESPYDNGVNRYPDPHQKALKNVLGELKNMPVEQIFVGNGSDEAIDLMYRIFCRPGIDNVVSMAPSYGMYSVAAAMNDVEFRAVQLNADFSLDTRKMLAACDENTKLMWVCSPNNPTGNAFPLTQIETLAEQFHGILVVDEAYVDFANESLLNGTLQRHENIVVLQTLSKAWGMAGLRLGLAFAAPLIIDFMSRVKYPYNVNGPTQVEVIKRLKFNILQQVEEIKSERDRLIRELPKMPCVKQVFPSDANFILVKVDDPNALYDELVKNGIIVRNRSKIRGCEGCLRITVGRKEENRRVEEIINNK